VVVGVFVARETGIHRLPEQSADLVLDVLGLIKDGRPTMLGISTNRAEGRRPMRKLYVGILCHETVWEMRVGPSEPACRDRLQTTVSGVSKELGSLASRKRQTRDSVR